ncbi:hypothetical protein [Aestuariibius sp. HNIBRBA575]|uniref:hypothetical protein n=1 Tax=Aestuariibius sp. HNIBRBA575 TaxID=3233343 RepID=UPI0034A43119
MYNFFQRFRGDETGAVTVDWVVLTAAIVGLGIGVVTMISVTATDRSKGVGNRVENQALVQYN